MNGTLVKNQLIFDFASGKLGPSKSVFASTYLFLNSKASKINNIFENLLGEDLENVADVKPINLKFTDCIKYDSSYKISDTSIVNPISKLVGPLDQITWKQVYKGFKEYIAKTDDTDELKLIKMEPGASVPLHSHNGKEFILVLEGNFCDEYGNYNVGDIQINDQKVKHTPVACNKNGCICLTITEKDVIFFGRYGSFLNLFSLKHYQN